MWLVWLVAMLSAALIASCIALLRHDLRAAPRSWQLLAWSGILLALGGSGFVVRFWKPTPGPYIANQLYPLGPYVNAWAVSFGFMWLAFGLVFFALAVRGPHAGRTWFTLLVAWVLAWLPHGVIGVGFTAAGSNDPSVRLYQEYASTWPGLVRLVASAGILVVHFGLSLLGFALAGMALLRARRLGPAADVTTHSRNWWLLVLPFAYLLHLGEEWWGGEGFATWTARFAGSPVSTTRFIVLNSIVWPLFCVLTVAAILRPRLAWFPTTFATVVLINAALHALGTLVTSTYSPGLITGLALYLPAGLAALSLGRRSLSPRAFTLAAVLGVLIHGLVVVIAFA